MLMSQSLNKIRTEALALPIEEREILAEELRESIYEDAEVDSALDKEIGERIEAYDDGGDASISHDEMRKKVAQKYGWRL